MKNKFIIALVSTFLVTSSTFAESYYNDSSFYTGENFFSSPKYIESPEEEVFEYNSNTDNDDNARSRTTTPPIKKLRESIKKRSQDRAEKQKQLAPTDPNANIYNSESDTSVYASKEEKEDFDENMMPDGFEADEEAVIENKNSKHFWAKGSKSQNAVDEENTENIVLDCDNMDYDTDNYCLYATGNVSVEFVKQETTVKADKITYDRMNNTIKAEGNVHIVKNGQIVDGDYIFVDMNEENALIENPSTKLATVEIKAKKGYVYGDKIVQENGSIEVDESYPIKVRPSGRSPQLHRMIVPKEQTLTNDMFNGLVKVKARELTITQKGDLETLAIKHADVKKGKYTILKVPAIKIYTNKNHDYVETNVWELGSYRDLGSYIGPGFVFELPKGSVLKAIPMLNYDHKIGVGILGRFNSGTNFTQAAYGTADSRILIRGEQKLDDHLSINYAMNDYIDEWWLGGRRPKYGLNLEYRRKYEANNFLLKGRVSSYEHMFDFGYYQDIDRDKHYGELISGRIGTTRARYMAEANQSFYKYTNIPKQTAFELSLSSEFAASLYGTGDTQVIGRIGPRFHTQWKRWMQDLGYYQSVYDDNTPMPVYDAYRYGKSNFYVREYFRLNKYLTLSWFGSLNLSNDSPNGKMFQENTFYLSIGPDDIRFNIGYDFIRQNTFFSVAMQMDAKGTHIDYDKLVIKRDKKPSDEVKESNETPNKNSNFQNSEKAPVLERAEVTDIKAVEDVL